jgi:hypothetical protein
MLRKRCSVRFLIAALITALLISQPALSHTRLKASPGVAPRSTNAGIKTGPCGGFARIAAPPTLNAGSTLKVYWEETIDHPGRFEVYFSKAGQANFVILKTIEDTLTGAGSGPTPHQYSADIVLPNETCTDCTLQLIQVMTENPLSPSLYYSCADMILVPNGTTPTPTPMPSPTPGASPTPTATPPAEPCH